MRIFSNRLLRYLSAGFTVFFVTPFAGSEDIPLWEDRVPHLFETETLYLKFDRYSYDSFRHLAGGWREPYIDRFVIQKDTFWATSIHSEMHLSLMRKRDLKLSLTMFPMYLEKMGAQQVTLVWNGQPIGVCEFVLAEKWNEKESSFTIPESVQNIGVNQLRFLSRFANSDVEMGGKSDGRIYSFSIDKLTITDSDAAPPSAMPQLVREDQAILQPPDTRLAFPFKSLENTKAKLVFGELPAKSSDWKILLRRDSPTGPVDSLLADNATANEKEMILDLGESSGEMVELVFDTTGAKEPVRWVAPKLTLSQTASSQATWNATGAVPQPKRVLFIIWDACSAREFGCYGYFRNTTPNADRLAKEAVRFERAYSTASYTYSSTWATLTGLYPFQHQAYETPMKVDQSVRRLQDTLKQNGVYTACVSAQHWISPTFGTTEGFDEYHSAVEGAEILVKTGEPERVTDLAFEVLTQHKDKKLFMYMHYRQPHSPYYPPKPYQFSMSTDVTNRGKVDDGTMRGIKDVRINVNREELEQIRTRYDENLLTVDAQLGRLTEWLKGNGLADDTLIVLTADHGETFLEHGYLSHGKTLYNDVTHVPLIMWGADVEKSLPPTVTAPVSTVQLYPTFCSLFGIEDTGNVAGQNLFNPKPVPENIPLISAQGCRVLDTHLWDPLDAFWWERYKLIVDYSSSKVEVFDLLQDPGERSNLSVLRPVLTDYLRANAFAWQRSQADKIAPPPTMQEIVTTPKTQESLEALGYL